MKRLSLCQWFWQWTHKSLTKLEAFKNWHTFPQRGTCFKEFGSSLRYFLYHVKVTYPFTESSHHLFFKTNQKVTHPSPHPDKKGHTYCKNCAFHGWPASLPQGGKRGYNARINTRAYNTAPCQDKYPIVTSENEGPNVFLTDILCPQKFLPKFFWPSPDLLAQRAYI